MGAKFFDETTFETLSAAGVPYSEELKRILARFRGDGPQLSKGIRRMLNIVDRQDALQRFAYGNEYPGLDPVMIERVLYYRGEGMLFKWLDKHYFLPYALCGEVDEYGRYLEVRPLIFSGSGGKNEDAPWLEGVSFRPVYDVPLLSEWADKSPEEIEAFMDRSCVLIHDYSPGIAQQVTARNLVNAPVIDVMSDMIPYAKTALMNSTGVVGVPVDAGQESSVYVASAGVDLAAVEGRKYVPILRGTLPEMQELTGGQVAKAEEFFLAMQSLDNFRLSSFGLDNGGIFQKKAHELQAEAELAGGAVGLVLEDSLRQRQRALTIYNTIHGGSMWVEPSEAAAGGDRNMDTVEGDDYSMTNGQGGGESDV